MGKVDTRALDGLDTANRIQQISSHSRARALAAVLLVLLLSLSSCMAKPQMNIEAVAINHHAAASCSNDSRRSHNKHCGWNAFKPAKAAATFSSRPLALKRRRGFRCNELAPRVVELRGGESDARNDLADSFVSDSLTIARARNPPILHSSATAIDESLSQMQSEQQPQLKQQQQRRRLHQLWIIPFAIITASFLGFSTIFHGFHHTVQWASSNTWIPTSESDLNLQTNVITQVVNGPVITSISILFATLASMTISSLYERQQTIRKATATEMDVIGWLDILWHQVPSVHPIPNSIPGDGVGGMESATTQDDLHHQLAANFARGQALIDKYKQQLDQEFQQQPTTNSFAHGSIAEEPSSYTTLHSLLSWSHDLYRWQAAMQRAKQAKQQRVTANMIGRGIKRRNGRRNTSNNERETEPTRALEASDEHPYSYAIALSDHWIATLQEHVMALMQQQQIRSMAHATRFPPVHWMTLTLLAGGIAISFLVATDQQEFLMQSLQVRILWSVLVGSFTSLAVLCFDLNRPFEGAYKIPSSRT